MDGHLIIGLLMFKHVLVSFNFATGFRFVRTLLCGVVVFSKSYMYQSYSGWNMLNIFPYLKKMIKTSLSLWVVVVRMDIVYGKCEAQKRPI